MSEQTPKERIRVLIADDHYIVRQGLRAIIATTDDLVVVGEASDGPAAVKLFADLLPDVAVIDLRMPGLDGIATMAAILDRHPAARLVALTNYEGDDDIARCLEAGAWTYMLKKSADDQLPEMLRAVARGEKVLPDEVAATVAKRRARCELTAREHNVLTLIARGQSNKQIADSLSLSVSTVNTHVANILLKLGVDDRTHAVVAAIKRGIVHLD